jgi:hypothetical protein
MMLSLRPGRHAGGLAQSTRFSVPPFERLALAHVDQAAGKGSGEKFVDPAVGMSANDLGDDVGEVGLGLEAGWSVPLGPERVMPLVLTVCRAWRSSN